MDTDQEFIRISCAALCRIEIGGRFLLEVNKNRGDVLTPIGGALEFHEAARAFLESLGTEFQKGNDLRLTLPLDQLPAFEHWFHQRKGRETDPMRELKEELVEEHELPVTPSTLEAASWRFLGCLSEERETSRRGIEGTPTHYFHEIHQVILPTDVEDATRKAAVSDVGRLRLVDREEIERGCSGGLRVASTARVLFRFS